MTKRSKGPDSWESTRQRIIGLGDRSIRKSHYPQLQQRLAELERFRALLDETGDAIFLLELPSLVAADVNRTACRILGHTKKDLLQKPFSQLLKEPERAGELRRQDFSRPSSRGKNIVRAALISAGGHPVEMEMTLRGARFSGRDYVVVVARDISQRIVLENRAKELERQLRLSQKMEAIGTMAGGIAHDFNNILAAVMNFTELAMLQIPGQSLLRTYMDNVLKASVRARDLVRQILLFSRHDKGELQPVDVLEVLEDTLEIIQATSPSSISIARNIEGGAKIMGVRSQIQQVYLNICANACHAMESEGGVLEISLGDYDIPPDAPHCDRGLAPGRYAHVTIRDNGQGMDDATMERIFEPYFTTKEMGKGSGLGMAVVHGIVRSHQGMILVDSELGKGSVVQVFLPSMDQAPKKVKQAAQAELPRGTEHILFVDDESPLVQSTTGLLKMLGYQVTAMEDPRKALDIFLERPEGIDAVITDLSMPGMNGDRLAREILAARPRTPIILCTGFSEGMDEEKAQRLGVKSLMMKPLALASLARTLRRALDGD